MYFGTSMQGMNFSSDIGVRRLIILPIPTTRDGAYITGTETELSALLDLLDEGTFLAGYGIPRWLREAVISRGGRVYDSGEDETFLLENAKKIIMLAEAGALVEELSAGADFSGLDIIINTAPETLIPEETVGKLIDGGTHLIELASGKNYSDERVVRMASIPDKMYPLSAGRLYARSIARAIRQRKNGG